jgi:hypothetical protein
MTGTPPTATTIHLAVLSDPDTHGTDTISAVLAYDARGRRHLHPVQTPPPPELLARLVGRVDPGQLQLPLELGTPAPTSAGRCWRTWVLPSVPTSLRTLPPEQLAAALAEQLHVGVAS